MSAAASPWLGDAAALLAKQRRLAGLPAGAAGWLLARGLQLPAWLVLPDRMQADRMARILEFHLPRSAGGRVLRYPADELPPYSGVAPHPARVADRLLALDALQQEEPVLVVAEAKALAARVARPGKLRPLELREGSILEREALLRSLNRLGYQLAVRVEDPGTYAVRGGVVDLWPTGSAAPVRLDFFDDELELLRSFDPESQRNKDAPLRSLRVLPTREWLPDKVSQTRLAVRTRQAAAGQPQAAALRRRVIEALRSRLSFSGVEDWLPALHPVCSPLELAPGAQLAVFEPSAVAQALERFCEQARRRHEELAADERPLVPPTERYEAAADVSARLAGGWQILPLPVEDGEAPADRVPHLGALSNHDLALKHGELAPLAARLKAWLDDDWRLALVATGSADAERLAALLQPHGLQPEEVRARESDAWPPGRLSLLLGDLPRGFRAPGDRLALLSSDELFGRRRRPAPRGHHHAFQRARRVGLGQLKKDDLVVHADHGIGLFRGMARVNVDGEADFVLLEYRGGDRLYVPVHKLDMLSRYRSASEGAKPRLDRLGGQGWGGRKGRARDAMLSTAHELLQIYAQRSLAKGRSCDPPGRLYRRFAAAFQFEETADQLQAIAEVEADLRSTRPMDRLVVGDVGFGKTEVAMRAAARVVESGRQVAVLCPTTVLAYQHDQTFRERFRGFPFSIAMLSRFQNPKEAREVSSALASGAIDILVGTTRMLGKQVRFADLGLLVVDEEHRFGVRQKERIKKLRAQLDVLSLSATPIPRTLSMALSGVRSFSTIATPPAERLSVRTRIVRYDEGSIRQEVMRELSRGGQVFFVHNSVRSIPGVERRLAEIVPEASIAVTHGQMPSAELEQALVRFVRKKADLLLTTSIIESGVDLPNVNCVIVDRADRFGLAQLYQIRGRVGRSWRRGRCVLLVPAESNISRKATRRLRVLLEHQELGSGFMVASADMEQRGAGTILGDNQHGHVDAVGFDTYVELLEEVLAEARGGLLRKRLDPEVEIPLPALIPESLIPGIEDRLAEYRRLTSAETSQQVRRMLDALEQRHGELPMEMLNLGWLVQTRLSCRELGVARLSWLKVRVELQLDEQSPVTQEGLQSLARQLPDRVDLPGTGRMGLRFTPEEAQYPFRFAHWALRLLKSVAEKPAKA